MRGTIKAPRKIITGAFNIILTFQREVELTIDDIVVELIEGDPLGNIKDSFGGSGKNYHILCYVQDSIQGRSRISISGFDVSPVEITYDTMHEIIPLWGQPFRKSNKIEIPLTFPSPIRNLRKGNFQISRSIQHYLYGSDQSYQLLLVPKTNEDFSITVSGNVEKSNGIAVSIDPTVIEVSNAIIS